MKQELLKLTNRILLRLAVMVVIFFSGTTLTSMTVHADQNVINSLPNGIWYEKKQFNVYGGSCASGRAGMGSVRIFIFGKTIEINIDWHNLSFTDYRGGLNGLRIKGRISERHHEVQSVNCRNILGFSGTISADGRTITIREQSILRQRGCTVIEYGRDKTVIFVRLR